jgi:predicted nucleic acid-binding Zn ribbon protein
MRKPIPISELLALGRNRLQTLQAGADSANRVLGAVQRALPPDLAAQVFGASVDEAGVLTVLVPSGAYATRLRYALPERLAAIEADVGGGAIRRAQIRVRPREGA